MLYSPSESRKILFTLHTGDFSDQLTDTKNSIDNMDLDREDDLNETHVGH